MTLKRNIDKKTITIQELLEPVFDYKVLWFDGSGFYGDIVLKFRDGKLGIYFVDSSHQRNGGLHKDKGEK